MRGAGLIFAAALMLAGCRRDPIDEALDRACGSYMPTRPRGLIGSQWHIDVQPSANGKTVCHVTRAG